MRSGNLTHAVRENLCAFAGRFRTAGRILSRMARNSVFSCTRACCTAANPVRRWFPAFRRGRFRGKARGGIPGFGRRLFHCPPWHLLAHLAFASPGCGNDLVRAGCCAARQRRQMFFPERLITGKIIPRTADFPCKAGNFLPRFLLTMWPCRSHLRTRNNSNHTGDNVGRPDTGVTSATRSGRDGDTP